MSEKPDVSEGNKRILQWMVPTVFVFMIVLIIAFAPDGDMWLGRIHKFQGLIAGALAILGAILTVQKMHTSDERADKRHQDLVMLDLRSDAIAIQRIAESDIIIDLVNQCHDCRHFFENEEQRDEEHAKIAATQFFDFLGSIKSITTVGAIGAIKPLLDMDGYKTLRGIEQNIFDLEWIAKQTSLDYPYASRPKTVAFYMLFEWEKEFGSDILFYLNEIQIKLLVLNSSARRIQIRYAPIIDNMP